MGERSFSKDVSTPLQPESIVWFVRQPEQKSIENCDSTASIQPRKCRGGVSLRQAGGRPDDQPQEAVHCRRSRDSATKMFRTTGRPCPVKPLRTARRRNVKNYVVSGQSSGRQNDLNRTGSLEGVSEFDRPRPTTGTTKHRQTEVPRGPDYNLCQPSLPADSTLVDQSGQKLTGRSTIEVHPHVDQSFPISSSKSEGSLKRDGMDTATISSLPVELLNEGRDCDAIQGNSAAAAECLMERETGEIPRNETTDPDSLVEMSVLQYYEVGRRANDAKSNNEVSLV